MDKKITSLSEAYPQGTAYYYGYPVGWDSSFLNHCPPEVEELVAMRPAVCAGEDTKVVVYANTVSEKVLHLLRDELGVSYVADDQLIKLPPDIDATVLGNERNQRVKDALGLLVPDGTLAMAQPYLDPALQEKYLILPQVTAWLNDKRNTEALFPLEHRIPEYARCANGKEFFGLSGESLPYPCVVKVSSSSAGDGVRLCKNIADFHAAQKQFRDCEGLIFVQKMIDISRETEVKFAVPQNSVMPAELLGYSDEITGTDGEYLGGVIVNEQTDPAIQEIFETLQKDVLPIARSKGWHGVGGVGVLMDKDGAFYFCDPNFRMTAMMPQVMQMNGGAFGKRSILGFGGHFNGNVEEFSTIGKRARAGDSDQILNVVAMAQNGGRVNINGGVLFDQPESLAENIAALRSHGIQSEVFDALHHVCLQKYLQ